MLIIAKYSSQLPPAANTEWEKEMKSFEAKGEKGEKRELSGLIAWSSKV